MSSVRYRIDSGVYLLCQGEILFFSLLFSVLSSRGGYSEGSNVIILLSDLSDVPENLPLPAPGSESPPQALNYSQIASAAVAVSQSAQDPSVSSTETLLRNIQGLLKVAADNARQQERQINYEKGQWQGFLKTLEGALHNFIIFQLSQNHIKRH